MSHYNSYIDDMVEMPDSRARELVVQAQVDRSHILYQKYFEREESRQLVDFFFAKIYSLDGKAERDHLTRKTVNRVRNYIKATTREKLDKLLLLNDITDYLDIQLAHKIIERGWVERERLTQSEYEELYVSLDNRPVREEQLELLLWNFDTFFALSRSPVIKMMIPPLKMATKLFGARSLFELFDQAYKASASVSEELFQEFLESVKTTEAGYIRRLFSQSPAGR